MFELTRVPSSLCDPHSHLEEGATSLWEMAPRIRLLDREGWSVLLGPGGPCQHTGWCFLGSSARHLYGPRRGHGAAGGSVAGAGYREVWVSGCWSLSPALSTWLPGHHTFLVFPHLPWALLLRLFSGIYHFSQMDTCWSTLGLSVPSLGRLIRLMV